MWSCRKDIFEDFCDRHELLIAFFFMRFTGIVPSSAQLEREVASAAAEVIDRVRPIARLWNQYFSVPWGQAPPHEWQCECDNVLWEAADEVYRNRRDSWAVLA